MTATGTPDRRSRMPGSDPSPPDEPALAEAAVEGPGTGPRRSSAVALLTAGLWPLAVTGCGGGGSSSPGFQVRDSAGVTVVENTAPRWGEDAGWSLSERPSTSIGVLEGDPEDQLFRVRGAVRLEDGRLVVANAGTGEVRFYSPDGRFIHSAGREGEGPGEFGAMGPLYRLGPDSLLVWDNAGLRMSVFDTAGAFVRAF